MPTAEENSENWAECGDLLGFEGLDKFSSDIEAVLAILSEDPVPSQNQPKSSPEELSCKNSFQGEATAGEVNNGFSQSQDGVQEYEAPQVEAGLAGSSVWCPSTAGIQSVCMLGNPGNSSMAFDHSNIDALCHFDSPLHTSVNLRDWSTSCGEHDTCSSREMDGGTINAHFYSSKSTSMLNQIPNYGTTLNFSAGDSDLAPGYTDNVDLSHLKRENGYEFKHAGENYDSQSASHLIMMEESNLAFRDNSDVIGSNKEDLGLQETSIPTSNMDAIFINSEMSFGSAHPQLNDNKASIAINQYPVGSLSECFSIGNDLANSSQFRPHKFDLLCMTSMEETMARTKGELEDKLCKNSKINFKREGIVGLSVLPESSSVVCTETNSFQDKVNIQGMARYPPIRMKSFCDPDGNTVNTPRQLTGSNSVTCHSGIVGDEGYFSGVSRSPPNGVVCGPSVDNATSHLVTDTLSLISSKRQKISIKDEKKDDLVLPMSFSNHSTKYSGQVVKSSLSVCRSHVDDDPDICILEDISDPRHPPALAGLGKSLVTSQHLQNDPLYLSEHAGMRLKANDERLTFRVALQDLSQPKSEASPPDGVLAVPLMRHQRIALSWMVQKETVSLHCSGGILADDQGLGKTISTIALILKERPPLSKTTLTTMKQDGTKALNLDDDDDDDTSACMPEIKHEGYSVHMEVSTSSTKNEAAFSTKGRPAAGTLIVCPTSVLRQWAEELRNKVTREANLSVLVYHGSNRTKDPLELAKYDVVVTTYSIVSMEVPKQSLVNKDDGEKVKPEGHDLSPMELSCKKRKYPPSSDKKNRKDKKGIDGALLESVARPLARVGWFRVVLDEAQSIKNHRTQVARACWGLRAKRRWCLSGTPIQNAVDDLYSYFRFLRYDPYAVYKLFCSMIKVPINRNPTNGYKKLQAVLKTIMLRRTKGTCIDGEPIINLPPKTVELRKVEFSMEERDFYSKLEADSRAQFKLYAAAGTVQQNYVNILLMLLRLRQACDHPHLVKGFDSNSVWRSSLETAKKLPREKQTVLLSCLEASLAICGICNDSPEEAVVTICGHVFCNQCISEHLTGDDNLCPASQCKVQLNATSVFSSATLKHTLFDQPNASQTDLALDPCSEGFSDSSKIKTALEVLESLSNSKVSSINPISEVPRTAADSQLLESSKDMLGKEISDKEITDKFSSKISEKAIVFSQWTRMLDLLESRLKTSSIQYRRLDGTMSVVARDKAVKDFNTLPEVTVMIMSLKAASLGLNMVAACHVLLLDLWWNPTTEDQAIDRAHRIGQTRPVSVLRLTVKDTVEDRILALQQKKREMVASAFGEDETGSRQSRLTVDDLKYLFMD